MTSRCKEFSVVWLSSLAQAPPDMMRLRRSDPRVEERETETEKRQRETETERRAFLFEDPSLSQPSELFMEGLLNAGSCERPRDSLRMPLRAGGGGGKGALAKMAKGSVPGWWVCSRFRLNPCTPPPPAATAGQLGLAEPGGGPVGTDTWASPHRLFDLEPDLLPLFQYNCRQFSSPEDCLSSPEFLDHIRKVRQGRAASEIQQNAFLGENERLGIGKVPPALVWSHSPPAAPPCQGHLLLAFCAEPSRVWGTLCSASWSEPHPCPQPCPWLLRVVSALIH